MSAAVEAPVQKIKGWSVLRDFSESTLSTLCALFFIMSPDRHPGYPNDGAHYISTPNYDNVGYQKVQGKDNKEVDNIVVRGMTTVGLSILSD